MFSSYSDTFTYNKIYKVETQTMLLSCTCKMFKTNNTISHTKQTKDYNSTNMKST